MPQVNVYYGGKGGMIREMNSSLAKWFAVGLAAIGLSGCGMLRDFQPSVTVNQVAPEEYIARQRGDILTTGELSAQTMQTIRVTGLDMHVCATPPTAACIAALSDSIGISDERKLSALSELWLARAMSMPDSTRVRNSNGQSFTLWMEAARHAYGYLFFTARSPGDRAFEDRQTQVRDWYNYAVQQAIILLFQASSAGAGTQSSKNQYTVHFADWVLHVDMKVRLPEHAVLPRELLPASSMIFKGLRSTYRRDGFGSELVAVTAEPPLAISAAPEDSAGMPARRSRRWQPPAWSEMPSPNITVVLRFRGETLDDLLKTDEVYVSVHDPLVENELTIRGQHVPLSGNFTAGYGLWLARAGFNRQSLRSLFGREQGIDRPHLYMMQPFDPNRRIILMLHGLASSPEAWVNVANEILGDEALRKEYQVWQVYYPTNMPVAINHATIRRLLRETLRNFDPNGDTAASAGLVIVGHSMGGVIARLMVSSADEQLWNWIIEAHKPDAERLDKVHFRLDPMLRFEPFPGVERAIFIAAPHRGTSVAGHRLVRWVAGFIRFPLSALQNIDEALTPRAHAADASSAPAAMTVIQNSIDNLDERDSFIRATANLPISDQVLYHSIIARTEAEGPLEETDDGLVPYRSSHLAGAVSEKVIVSGHSVQETAASILEIRRILHEDLAGRGKNTIGP